MMTKALDDLNVAELRHELKERQLNPKGKKEELRERLESWIIDNGYDVDGYEFLDPYLKQISSDMKLRDDVGIDRKILRDEIGANIKILRDEIDDNIKRLEGKKNDEQTQRKFRL